MRGKVLLTVIIVLVFAASFVGQWLVIRSESRATENAAPFPRGGRIVSTSPSVTEALFELGLGDSVVGVTTFCTYPPEAQKIDEVGGYIDINYEAIVALRPDIVVLLKQQVDAATCLGLLGIRTIAVDHTSVEGILDSFITMGTVCGAGSRGEEIAADLNGRMRIIARKTRGLSRPKVIVCVERARGAGVVSAAFVVGRDGFYERLIRIAGGECAFAESKTGFPMVDAVDILMADPDIVIEMAPRLEGTGLDRRSIRKDWEWLPEVSAVKNNQVYVFSEDFMVIPGPRFILILEELARLIHPEVEWD